MKKMFITLIALFLTANSFAKPAENTILLKLFNKLDGLQGFSCTNTFAMPRAGNDTIHNISTDSFFKNEKDSIAGYSFILESADGVKQIYDGINVIVYRNSGKDYYLYDARTVPKFLTGTLSSPVSIRNLLNFCLTTDSACYTINKDKNGDYELKITFPYIMMEGFVPIKTEKSTIQKTELKILFDKQTFLPKYYYKEFLYNDKIKQSFTNYFNNYKTFASRYINAIDSIPADFHLFNKENVEKSAINKQAPNFKLKQIDGDTIELYNIENKYVMLEFSTLHCGGCITATPFIVKIIDSLPVKINNFFVIDMENHSNIKELSKYIEKNKINYSYLLDGRKVASEYNISIIPTFILLDNNKKIVEMMIGFNEDKFKKMIEKIN